VLKERVIEQKAQKSPSTH